jgi:transcriptional regulator NrdR family protein
MLCPKCRSKTDVYDTRVQENGDVRRRRACLSCGHRFASLETLNHEQPLGKKHKNINKPEKQKAARVRKSSPTRVEKTPKRELDPLLAEIFQDDLDDVAPYLDIPKGYGGEEY